MNQLNPDEIVAQLFAYGAAIHSMIETHPDKAAFIAAMQRNSELVAAMLLDSRASDEAIEAAKKHMAGLQRIAHRALLE